MIQEIVLIVLIYFSQFNATVTAYSPQTTDARWNHVARWTGEPPIVGVSAACPESWRMKWIHVENYGLRQCQDTPKHGWYVDEWGNTAPHIDLFLGSQQEALYHGIQRLTVWKGKQE